ncbi:MAG: ATP-dependent sacrificial sulfur transferase LarE [Deltaproteobacteria bacterium]|nr:MAG: ATP-dependent sacrificial sulfur transferase LarE [Deltaproteobacteria bacterium]
MDSGGGVSIGRTGGIIALILMRGQTSELNARLAQLQNLLSTWRRGLLLFSGGIDSGLLFHVASNTLGAGLAALTLYGPHNLPRERRAARQWAQTLGVTLFEHEFNPLELPDFRDNTSRRCYACKGAMYRLGQQVLSEWGGEVLFDGANRDDLDDYRPGQQAARELGVRSPLQEVGFTKAEIRALSRELSLSGWDKPAQSCLATRFPPNTRLTRTDLEKVATVEEFLQNQGLALVRLRVHGPLVRLEISPDEWPRLLAVELRTSLTELIQRLGWLYLTLDLKGYQTGSMNPEHE